MFDISISDQESDMISFSLVQSLLNFKEISSIHIGNQNQKVKVMLDKIKEFDSN